MDLPEAEWPRIPGYKLLAVKGGGGYGVVFVAEEDSLLRKTVAIKVCWPSAFQDPEGVEHRFVRESRTLANLNHPQVVSYIHSGFTGEEERKPYLVMGYVDGTDCRQQAPPTVERACETVVGVLDSLEYCHSKDVIHRDLKPANIIMRDVDQRPVIVDFGLSLSVTAAVERITKDATGTPGYMAPELVADPLIRDVRLDVYSMGVVLYEFIAGRLPNPLDYRTVTAFRADVDPAIDDVIKSCLAPAHQRFPTVRLFRDSLSAWLALYRERATHGGKLSPRAQSLRTRFLVQKLARVDAARALGQSSADRVRLATAQMDALNIKTVVLFEETLASLGDQIPGLKVMKDGEVAATACERLGCGPEAEFHHVVSITAGQHTLTAATLRISDLFHLITREPLFRSAASIEGALLDLQRASPLPTNVMQPMFLVFSWDASNAPRRPWIHLVVVMVFEESQPVEKAAVVFVAEHHPRFVQVEELVVQAQSPDVIQDEVWRVVESFAERELLNA